MTATCMMCGAPGSTCCDKCNQVIWASRQAGRREGYERGYADGKDAMHDAIASALDRISEANQ